MKLKDTIASKTLTSESGAFLVVIVVIWLNEIAGLPYHFLGAPKTPINFEQKSDVEFTHGMRHGCIKKYYPEYTDKVKG